MNLRYLATATFALALAVPSMASAQQVPAQVPLQAYLTNSNGVPVNGSKSVTVSLYKAKTGGSSVFTTTKNNVSFKNGSATLYLGKDKTLNLSVFENNKDLWAEVSIGGQALTPRIRVATAPYAAVAGTAANAKKLDGKSPGNLISQNSCGSGEAAYGIKSDGTLMCRSVSSGGLSAGNGISISSGTISVEDSMTDHSDIDLNSSGDLEIPFGEVDSTDIGDNAVGSGELQDDSVEDSHLEYGCGSTYAEPQTFDKGSVIGASSCPFQDNSKAGDLPRCDSVPPGAYCEYDGSCSNSALSLTFDNCNNHDVYIKVAP